MTISYQRDVASSTAGGFTRILFKWKGGSLSPDFLTIETIFTIKTSSEIIVITAFSSKIKNTIEYGNVNCK